MRTVVCAQLFLCLTICETVGDGVGECRIAQVVVPGLD